MRVVFTVTNKNPNTIYNRLAARLGRDPSSDEIKAEINRILSEGRKEKESA